MEDSVDLIIAQWTRQRPDIDLSNMATVGRLSRIAKFFEASMLEVFRRHDLNSGEFDILATLRRADTEGNGLTAGELATNTMVTSGAITNRLDRLVAKGLVTRETDPNSRRTIRVSLTPKGRTVLDRALGDHLDNEAELLAPFSSEQREQFNTLLRVLLTAQESARDSEF